MFGSSQIIVRQDFAGIEKTLRRYDSIFVVCDRNARRYADDVIGRSCKRYFKTIDIPCMEIEATEENKTLATVGNVVRWLLMRGAGRDALVLAVGGGITNDIVGFAAGIYKRGVAWANVPTTLLAQVDAAIGGKTGVNVDSLKNMVGVIHKPVFTFINTGTLETLPEREFNCGAAELLKTFIIKDEGNYEKAVSAISSRYTGQLPELIEAAAGIKDSITRKDPSERGVRRVLNLGHTYGHAIEWFQHRNMSEAGSGMPADGTFPGQRLGDSAWTLKHGEAVAVGIIKAARMSEERGIAAPGLADKLVSDFRSCRLPVDFPCDDSLLREAVLQDKKKEGGKINFVFIKAIGKVVIKKITL